MKTNNIRVRSKSIRTALVLGAVAGTIGLVTYATGCKNSGSGSGNSGGGNIITGLLPPDVQKGLNMAGAAGDMMEASALADDTQAKTAIGESIVLGVTQQYPLDADEALNRYVTLVGLTVASAAGPADSGTDYVFGVLNTPEVQAFSTPSNHVMISRGALQRMRDESELAGVLGHEITHVRREHGIKSMANAKFTRGASNMAAATSPSFSGYQNLADLGVDAFLKNGYDKPSELTADAGAVELAKAAGYDPAGLLRFLETLEKEKATKPDMNAIMSTHPARDERIDKLKPMVANVGGVRMQERFAQNVPFAK